MSETYKFPWKQTNKHLEYTSTFRYKLSEKDFCKYWMILKHTQWDCMKLVYTEQRKLFPEWLNSLWNSRECCKIYATLCFLSRIYNKMSQPNNTDNNLFMNKYCNLMKKILKWRNINFNNYFFAINSTSLSIRET